MSSNTAEKLNALPIEAGDYVIARNATTDATVDYNKLEVLTSLCILTGIFQVSPVPLSLSLLSFLEY